MARKKRNYRAEYKRRIERALKLGYSRSIARGHPRTKTVRGKDGRKRKVVQELGLRAAKFLGKRPGTKLRELVEADAAYVFGEPPRRIMGDNDGPHYALRLKELERRDGLFDWTNEGVFIEAMRALGLTERDAYAFWFSP